MEVTEQTFQQDVIEQSKSVPVVVDFWADWCGPCKMLAPVLEQAVNAHDGNIVLAKVDVDSNQSLATEYGIRGIPAVKAFRDGQVVNEFVGAQSLPTIESFLDELTGPPASEKLLEELEQSGEFPQILGPLAEGDYERTFEWLLEEAAEADPERRERIREVMVALFADLGVDHPLSSQSRRRLASALY